MREFCYVMGTVIEEHRYINVPLRWCEQYPARERREFWLARSDHRGQEVKLTVHSAWMPARPGHEVCVLLHNDDVVGLANMDTGRQINFVRADPPLLVRRCDVVVTLGTLVAGFVAMAAWDARGLLLTIPCAALYLSGCTLKRLMSRWTLRRQVGHAIAEMVTAPPRLRRVR